MKRSMTLTILLLSLLALVALAGPAGVPPAYAAGIVVDSTANTDTDDGTCTLREAIINANNNDQTGSSDCAAGNGADTITFNVSGTIVLGSTLPNITDPAGLTVDGAGQNITISGNNIVQVVVVVSTAKLTVANLTVANGSSGGDGGGILNLGTLTVSNSIFSGNSAHGSDGGGIYNEGTLTVSNSTFSGNSADFDGGGIANALASTLTVSNSTFSGNSASSGGGIANALFGVLTVSNSTFSGNSASGGGGILNFDGTLRVSNSTFDSNSADDGAGIANADSAIIGNSTFSDNSAHFSGGGIANGSDSTLTVTNSTFSGNSADDGGGIVNDGTATLKNTIVANSTGGNCSGAIVNGGGNLSDDGTCPGINADPLLGPLQDNDGPTETMALLAGSPAIDAANDAVCAANPINNLDQRGVSRPQGAHCDIGAFELEQASNSSPAVAANSAAISVDEGATATNSGTVSDPDGDSVSLEASVGTVTNNDDGTWSWSLSTSDGPSESQTVTISADDDNGGTAETTFELVVDNVAPTADVGADQTVLRGEMVNLSGTWADPAGSLDEPYSWSWDLDGDGIADSSGSADYGDTIAETTSFATEGTYTLTFAVTDKDGGSSSDTVVIMVLNQAPDCSQAEPSQSSLWPPDHNFVSIDVLGVTDPDGDTVTITIDSIYQDEAVNAPDSGNTAPDGRIVDDDTVEVRAERVGSGNGRVYHIAFTADDGNGGDCSDEVLVGVPLSRKGTAVDSGPPLYDSTAIP